MAKTVHVVEKLIRDNNVQRGAEIGIWQGRLSYHLLQIFPTLMWIAVDPWVVYSDKSCLNQVGMDQMYADVCEKLSIFGQRVCISRTTSLQAVSLVSNLFLDMVYVDADHSYQAVKQDLQAWYPKIKQGGIISGHDYSSTRKRTVQRAVDEFFEQKNLELHLEACNVWWGRIYSES